MPSLTDLCDHSEAERVARLRSLQAIVRLIVGPTAGAELITALCQAEADNDVLAAVDIEFDKLATIPRPRILSSFAQTLPAGAR